MTAYISSKLTETEAMAILIMEGDRSPEETLSLVKRGARVVLCNGKNILILISGDLYITTPGAYGKVMAAFAA